MARIRVSLRFRLGLLMVALATLLLPLIYLALVVLVSLLVYLHLVYDASLLSGEHVGVYHLIGYLGPAIVGAVVVLFMWKPLLARPAKASRAPAIPRDELPLLFDLLEQISRAVRAPEPRELRLDMDVNASADFRRGWWSLLGRKDLTLTIGLPLLTGLELQQLAGVLAHELGHFAQGSGMRLTFVIRSIGRWLARVAYERDAWDVNLARYAETAPWQFGIVLQVARLFVWMTRGVLAGLTRVALLIASFMLREMEFDADRYEARLVGGTAFASTALRIRVLMLARSQALALFATERAEGRLLDDIAGLSAVLADRMSPELRAEIEATRPATGVFDTHPPDERRIERARAEGTEGIVTLEGPALSLIPLGSPVPARVTQAFYRAEGLMPQVPCRPCTVAEVLARQVHLQSEEGAAERYLGPFFGLFAPLEVTGAAPPTVTLEDGLEILDETRELVERLRPSPESPRDPNDEGRLAAGRAASRERLMTALALVRLPEVRARLDGVTEIESEIGRLLATLGGLAHASEAAKKVASEHDAVVDLIRDGVGEEGTPGLDSLLTHKLAALHGMTHRLERQLYEVPYPFDHSKASLSIGTFLGHGLPMVDGYEPEVHARSAAVLKRLLMLYQRTLDRLAALAEQIESTGARPR